MRGFFYLREFDFRKPSLDGFLFARIWSDENEYFRTKSDIPDVFG